MGRTPEIIEAVPQALYKECQNRIKLLCVTAGCMAANSGAFLVGIATPQAGDLAMLWMASLTGGLASTYLNFIRKEGLINKMESAQTTYTVKSTGRNRFLSRLLRGK